MTVFSVPAKQESRFMRCQEPDGYSKDNTDPLKGKVSALSKHPVFIRTTSPEVAQNYVHLLIHTHTDRHTDAQTHNVSLYQLPL